MIRSFVRTYGGSKILHISKSPRPIAAFSRREINIGETGEIKRIGGNEETRRFLNNLGFVVGAEVAVVSAIGGNVIVNIKDSRVAINEDMAKRIMV